MSILKVKKTREYASIDNRVLNDTRLSYKARGILVYLLGKPSNWVCHIKDLYNNSVDGYSSIRSGLKELILAGYIELKNLKNEEGQFTGRFYQVYEIPLFTEGYRRPENSAKAYHEGEELVEKPENSFKMKIE